MDLVCACGRNRHLCCTQHAYRPWGPRGLLLFGCWALYIEVKRSAREHHGTPSTDAMGKLRVSIFVAFCLKYAISGMHRFHIGPVVDILVFSMRHRGVRVRVCLYFVTTELWRVACRSGSVKQVNLAQLQPNILQHMKFRISIDLTFSESFDEAYV